MSESKIVKIEIIANHSMEMEIVSLFDTLYPELGYTYVPNILGKGKSGFRRGDAVWPESNFYLFSFCSTEEAQTLRKAVEGVKRNFPKEGIKVFIHI